MAAFEDLRWKRLRAPLTLFGLGIVIACVWPVPRTLLGEDGAVLLFMAFVVAFLGILFSQTLWVPLTTQEIATLASGLRLPRVQAAYLDCWLALRDLGPAVDPDGGLEKDLRRLIDEETRLIAAQARAVERTDAFGTVEVERHELADRLAQAKDPAARAALEHGLQTCERRLAAACEPAQSVERIDAELERIAQVALDVRDALRRLREAPEGAPLDLETTSIRQTLAHVADHAAALEAATAELRAL